MSDDALARLWELYEEHSAFGGTPVQDFVRSAAAGEYGEFSSDTLVALVEKLMASVMENIDMMAESNPALAEVADDKKEEQSAFYRKLIVEIRGSSS